MADDESTGGVYDALLARVRAQADGPALVFEDTTSTYAEFLADVDRTARYLSSRGVGVGGVVAAFGQNCPEILWLYYAAAKLGAILVPMNPNLVAAEVAYNLDDSGATLLFHDAKVETVAELAAPAASRIPFAELSEADINDTEVDAFAGSPDADFVIIYTSGSTGVPKAIVLSQRAQASAGRSLAEMWGVAPGDAVLVALPLGYLYGLSTAAGMTLQAGGTVLLLRRFHPRHVLEAMVKFEPAVFQGVPTMFSMMLEYTEQQDLSFDLSSLRHAICAGAPLPEEMRRRFQARFRVLIENYYALSEATPVFGRHEGHAQEVPAGAAGRLAPGAVVHIRRPDGTDCSVGEQGEIIVRAPATMSRYWNAPELTSEVLLDGFVRSGDLGHVDADGFYFITGRMKDVIIRGGANISPAEVEQELSAHPAVQDAAVLGVPDRIFGEVPAAVVVLRPGASAEASDLVEFLAGRVADFKVPGRIEFRAAMPVGKTGKVDRAALTAELTAGQD